jgi:hypothetical protein
MKTLTQLTSTLGALVLLAALAYGAYLGLQHLALLYAGLEAQVAGVTAIAVVALLLAAWWVSTAVRRAGRDRLAVPLREEKAATYRLFIDCWQQRLQQEQPSASLDESMASLDRLLALCGSASVVDTHTRLRALMDEGAHAREASWPVLSDALQQIRKELGAEPLAGTALQAVLASHAVVPVVRVTPAEAPSLAV